VSEKIFFDDTGYGMFVKQCSVVIKSHRFNIAKICSYYLSLFL